MEARWEAALVEWSEEWHCFTRTLFAPLWNQIFAISWAMRIQIMIDDQDQCPWDCLLCRKQSNPRNPISFNPGRIMNQGLAPPFLKNSNSFIYLLLILQQVSNRIFHWDSKHLSWVSSIASRTYNFTFLFSTLLILLFKAHIVELIWKIEKHYGIILN